MKKRLSLIAMLLAAASPFCARAEPPDLSSLRGRVDLYGTVAAREDASVAIEVRDLLAGTTRATAMDDATLRGGGGVRGVAWQQGKPWALGAELGYLDSRGTQLEAHITPLSVFAGVMATPPEAGERPARRPFPYAFAGVTTFTAWGNATAGSLQSRFRTGDWWTPGGDRPSSAYLAAGVTWPLSAHWSLLIDARVQRFHFDDLQTNSLFFPTRNVITDVTLDVSGITLGFSWSPGAPR